MYKKTFFITKEEFYRLTHAEQVFLDEAHAGYFRYCVQDGKLIVWGAPKAGNLFSMPVIETPSVDGESIYTMA
jgi:hypothetical protein